MLQQDGLVCCRRGRLAILQRAGLGAAASDCCRAIREVTELQFGLTTEVA
jgi:hypothetical protein